MNDSWALVIASGPSLTRADCEALRGFCPTVVVNCAVFMAPWAEALFASDDPWWKHYGPKIEWYKGQRYSRSGLRNTQKFMAAGRTGGNSGHQGFELARTRWPGRSYALIGFDHQHSGGATHFHGDHPRNADVKLGNANTPHQWVRCMGQTAQDLKLEGIRVVNLSRETALTCFERMSVEEFLNG